MNQSLVLYVDDDATNRRLMAKLFGRYREGDELLLAGSGLEAIEVAQTRRPQLVLLDLNLPDVSGEDVLTILRKGTDMSIVMVSGQADDSTRRRLIGLGADEYVTKPFDAGELFRLVDSLLTARI